MSKCEHEVCTIIDEEERGLSIFLISECDACKKIVEAEKN